MDDTVNDDKNQSSPTDSSTSQPVFESVPQPAEPVFKAEEVAPDFSLPQDIGGIPPDFSEGGGEEHRAKYMIIGGGVLFFIIVAFLIFRFAFGGRSSNQTVQKQVTLNYWGLWEEKEVMQPLIDEYQKAHPNVKINYQKMSPEEYRERLLARSRNGQGPDIFRFHNTWLPEIKEVIAPMPAAVMTPQEFDSTFYPIHQKDLKIGTDYYGIPLYIDGLVLIYNDTLLKQAGLTTPPSVWVAGDNDVLTAAGKLTVKDSSNNLITSGIALGTASNVEHFSDIFGVLLLLNGGDLKKLDQVEAAEALQIYRKFTEENVWSETMPNSITAFTEGKVAMIIAPSWQVMTIKAKNPDIAVKVAPLPKGLDGATLSLATYWVEGVSKFSPNQIEAWDFLKFLSSKESETKLFELQSKTRLFGNAYSRVDLANQLVNHEYLGPVIQQAEGYVSLPLVSRTADNGLNDEVIQYIRNAINATASGVDYAASLKTAQEGVRQVFEKYKIE